MVRVLARIVLIWHAEENTNKQWPSSGQFTRQLKLCNGIGNGMGQKGTDFAEIERNGKKICRVHWERDGMERNFSK